MGFSVFVRVLVCVCVCSCVCSCVWLIDWLTNLFDSSCLCWLQNVEDIEWERYWNPKLYVENSLGEPKETVWQTLTFNPKGQATIYERRRIKGCFLENLELGEFPFDTQVGLYSLLRRFFSILSNMHYSQWIVQYRVTPLLLLNKGRAISSVAYKCNSNTPYRNSKHTNKHY